MTQIHTNFQKMFENSRSSGQKNGNNNNVSEIQNFFKNQTIFITGGTGFLGKVMIEKLLRTCPDLRKIYIIVRPKKGKTMRERFNAIFDFPCFSRLKSERSDFRHQVSLICGDIEEISLGLSEEDREILKTEVTVIIHAAANVKFDQSLNGAYNINVRGTQEVVNLAKEMPQLQSFVYVSTFYANCLEKTVEERFYDPPMKAEDLANIINAVSEDTLEKIQPQILGEWPNTYVYSKCIAEDVIKEASKSLPISIVRPAIVISAFQEPIPGWIDNLYGVIGLVLAASLGVLRSLNAKLDSFACLVPVDLVSNQVLAAAWKTALDKDKDEVKIYNFVGLKHNMITWRSFMAGIEEYAWDFPTKKVLWYYCFNVRESTLWHNICVFFLHTVPAYLIDIILFCIGRTPLAVDNYRRINKLLGLLSYFSLNEWEFTNDNVTELWKKLGKKDKKLFNFDMGTIAWFDYCLDSIRGGRVYLLKDPLETIPEGHKKIRMLRVAHYTLVTVILYLFIKFVLFIVNLGMKLF